MLKNKIQQVQLRFLKITFKGTPSYSFTVKIVKVNFKTLITFKLKTKEKHLPN